MLKRCSTDLKGLTLLEIMLTSVLFFVVMGAVLFTLRNAGNNRARFDEREQATRACLLVMERLRTELRTAWVRTVEPSSLEYSLPERSSSGAPLIGPTGDAVWSPRITVTVADGKARRTQRDQVQILARLGPRGTLGFSRLGANLLQVDVHADYGTGYSLSTQFRQGNQF